MKLLLQQTGPQPVRQLALQLDVSEKTIKRDLQGLDNWLSHWTLQLSRVPERGVELRADDLQQRWQLEQQLKR